MIEYDVNERIATLRKQKHFSKKDFAKILGIKYTTYVRAEEKGHINTYLLKRIAEILDVDVRIILYGNIPDDKENTPSINKHDGEIKTPTKVKTDEIEKSPDTVADLENKNEQPLITIGYKTIDFSLTVMEKHLIEILRRVSPDDRRKVLDLINYLYNKRSVNRAFIIYTF